MFVLFGYFAIIDKENMIIWLYSLISVILVSAISLIGIFIIGLREERLKRLSFLLVAFAVGALFGDVFIHILPEVFRKSGATLEVSLFVILGILIFFALEKFLRWRHCHIPESKQHHHPMVFMNLVGDAVHNFIDGILIGASFLISFPIGVAATLAIILHEIPQEIGDFGMLIYGGFSRNKALIFNFLSSLTSIFGVLASLVLGSHFKEYTLALLPITAGGFLYIAGSDLIPELHREVELSTSVLQFVSMLLGIGIMVLLIFLG